jgi:ubiquinone/menaquinone biosynthesis C-methylase UbiE
MSNPSETYENYMVPALFAPWASRLIQSAEPNSGERILDVACGTGVAARQVALQIGSSGKIIGLDCNANMLAVARNRAARDGSMIEWQEGRAEELPFPDHSFDLVLCQFALMFFTDPPTALAEMHRVLKKGGRLMLSVWQSLDLHPFYKKLHDVIYRRFGMSGVQQIFALGNEPGLRKLFKDAGFEHVEMESASMAARFPNPDSFLAGEIDVDTAAIPSMQHLDDHARKEIIAAISNEMKESLTHLIVEDHVVIPFHACIVRSERRH